VIESRDERGDLIEIAARFRRIGCDGREYGAEPVEERSLPQSISGPAKKDCEAQMIRPSDQLISQNKAWCKISDRRELGNPFPIMSKPESPGAMRCD